MRILLTGADGQVGWELTRLLPALGEMMALNRKQCDLSDLGGLRSVVRKCKPDVLVNAAAYTRVDQAEGEPEAARIVNAAAPEIMAEELKRTSGLLVQYSTNYVFDGTKPGSYVEEDSPNPINAYGASKLEGERAIQQSGVDHLILRTSWVYAARGRNFLLTILRLFGEQQEIRIVADQIGTPTWSRWIAKQTIEVIRFYSAGDSRCRGIFHMTASGSTSRHGFASAIKDLWTPGRDRAVPYLVPITTPEHPTAARRPLNAVLCNAKANTLGLVQPAWKSLLQECMKELENSSMRTPS